MPYRPLREFRPLLEHLEGKQALSAGATALPLSTDAPGSGAPLADNQNGLSIQGSGPIQAALTSPVQFDRVTNPKGANALFNPPFGHVLVQTRVPVPGQVYNILFISVYNGSGRTFTSKDNITVTTSNTPAGTTFPILTGNQEWQPGGRIVFYVLTKKYYPFSPVQSAGFRLNFVSPKATAVPGPSGIALRVKYNPATFDKTLDYYVTTGPGSYGHQFGLPDTAIWAIYPPSARIIHL